MSFGRLLSKFFFINIFYIDIFLARDFPVVGNIIKEVCAVTKAYFLFPTFGSEVRKPIHLMGGRTMSRKRTLEPAVVWRVNLVKKQMESNKL